MLIACADDDCMKNSNAIGWVVAGAIAGGTAATLAGLLWLGHLLMIERGTAVFRADAAGNVRFAALAIFMPALVGVAGTVAVPRRSGWVLHPVSTAELRGWIAPAASCWLVLMMAKVAQVGRTDASVAETVTAVCAAVFLGTTALAIVWQGIARSQERAVVRQPG